MGKGLERETIILYNEEEQTADVFTYNVALQNKLVNLKVKVDRDNGYGGMSFTVPKRWVKVSPPRRMSEEQANAAAERLQNARDASKSTRSQGDLRDAGVRRQKDRHEATGDCLQGEFEV